MADFDEPISKEEKIRIASEFILHAPPGEFNEVFNDVRVLLSNDQLLREGASGAFAQYNKDQLTPCKLPGEDEPVLVTEHNDAGGGRYTDPRSKQIFSYDHLRKAASDLKPKEADHVAEPWRSAVESVMTKYVHNHFENGACSVFGSSSDGNVKLNICAEHHKFDPKNMCNGRWRSEFTLSFPKEGGSSELRGVLKVQVHYYQEGNVQLVSSKDTNEKINIKNPDQAAIDICNLITNAEEEYQKAINENYSDMSTTTFKALRRALPITRKLMEWDKILGYKIGQDLKNQ